MSVYNCSQYDHRSYDFSYCRHFTQKDEGKDYGVYRFHGRTDSRQPCGYVLQAADEESVSESRCQSSENYQKPYISHGGMNSQTQNEGQKEQRCHGLLVETDEGAVVPGDEILVHHGEDRIGDRRYHAHKDAFEGVVFKGEFRNCHYYSGHYHKSQDNVPRLGLFMVQGGLDKGHEKRKGGEGDTSYGYC